MSISNEVEAKLFASFAFSGHDEPDVAAEMLALLEAEYDEDSEIHDVDEAMMDHEPVKKWLALAPLEHGNYKLGIDRLMFQLIEKRAVVFALMSTSTTTNGFINQDVILRWVTNAMCSVFSAIATLNNMQAKDMSLRHLWNTVRPFLTLDAPPAMEELRAIEQQFEMGRGYPNIEEHLALLSIPQGLWPTPGDTKIWEAIDMHIQIWVRVWAIMGTWSESNSNITMEPASVAFMTTGIPPTSKEFYALKVMYDEYMSRVQAWRQTRLQD